MVAERKEFIPGIQEAKDKSRKQGFRKEHKNLSTERERELRDYRKLVVLFVCKHRESWVLLYSDSSASQIWLLLFFLSCFSVFCF